MLKLDHVTILSRDVAASERFYDALLPLLGMTKQKRGIWSDGAGFFLQFLPAREGTPHYHRYGPGLNHLGFGAPDGQFVDRVRLAMISAGFDIQPIQNLKRALALFMADPDGLRVELTYYPPGVPVVD